MSHKVIYLIKNHWLDVNIIYEAQSPKDAINIAKISL
jgi:hypothetical protein